MVGAPGGNAWIWSIIAILRTDMVTGNGWCFYKNFE